jgi:3-hydroxyacyl-CoA dehydrogenase
MVKHERACSENQHASIPFAFDTVGFLVPKTINKYFKKVRRVMHDNVVSFKSIDIVFKIIGFAIIQ